MIIVFKGLHGTRWGNTKAEDSDTSSAYDDIMTLVTDKSNNIYFPPRSLVFGTKYKLAGYHSMSDELILPAQSQYQYWKKDAQFRVWFSETWANNPYVAIHASSHCVHVYVNYN